MEKKTIEVVRNPLEFATKKINHILKLLKQLNNIRKDIKRGIEDDVEDLYHVFAQQDEHLTKIQDENIALRQQKPPPPPPPPSTSHNEAVSSTPSMSVPSTQEDSSLEHVILLYPGDDNPETQVEKLLHESIDPVKEGFKINNKRSIKNGGLLLSCISIEEVQKISNSIKDKLQEMIKIRIPRKKNPRLFISNVSENLDSKNIKEALIHQNAFIEQYINSLENEEDRDSALKVVFSIKSRNTGHLHWIIEVEPNLYKEFEKNKFQIFITWERRTLTEFLSVPRCRTCARLGHTQKYCKAKSPTCATCSEEHLPDKCPKQKMNCINCQISNNTKNTKHDAQHDAFDKDCPAFLLAKELSRTRINYG